MAFLSKLNLLGLFILFISISGFCAGTDLVNEGLMTQEALDALIAANQSEGYKIRLLKRSNPADQGQTQLIVFAGEIHIKNQRDSELGKALLNHFKVRGLEGLDEEASYLALASGKAIELIKQGYGMMTGNSYGSTILDAIAESPMFNVSGMKSALTVLENDLQRVLDTPFTIEALENDGEDPENEEDNSEKAYVLAEMDEEERKKGTIKFLVPDHQLGMAPKKVTFEELYLNRENIHSYFEWDPKKSTNFWLEANHSPDLGEKFASLYYPTYLGVCVAAACSLFPAVGSRLPEYVPQILQGAAVALVGQGLVTDYIERKSNYERILPTSLSPTNGLVHGRNRTMVKNLTEILNDFPELNSILVVVGMAHVPGMVQQLVSEHGFEPVELTESN